MKRVAIIAVLFILISSAAWAQTQWSSFSKKEIEFIKVFYRSSYEYYYVLVGLKNKINNVEGFFYYGFATLHEAVAFADLFRAGRIKNVEHFTSTSGKTATWYGKKMARIEKFGLK